MIRFSEWLVERKLEAKVLSKNDLINIEIFLDKLYSHIGIELDLHRKHFLEQMNHSLATGEPIYLREVKRLFEKIYDKYEKMLKKKAEEKGQRAHLLLRDIANGLNIPITLTTPARYNHSNMIAKTAHKSKDYKAFTGDVVLPV